MNDFVIAECEIRQLHARFIDAVLRNDAASFAACFAEAGEWKVAGMHFRGRKEIHDMFIKLVGSCARVQIIPSLPLLEVDGDSAIGRVQSTELCKMPDGSAAMALGVFYDRYEKNDGRWAFAWRHFTLHYRGPVDLSAELVDYPDYGPLPGLPEPDEPTATRRKLDD